MPAATQIRRAQRELEVRAKRVFFLDAGNRPPEEEDGAGELERKKPQSLGVPLVHRTGMRAGLRRSWRRGRRPRWS